MGVGTERDPGAIVVGHDGHPGSEAALRTAVTLARRLAAHLHVAHVVTLEDYGIDPDTDAFEESRDRNVGHERERIAHALAGRSVDWTYHERHGDPAGQLARLADEVDAELIVVGVSHRGVLRHVLTGGSVPKHLLEAQSRPVLVVPEPRRAR
jgi:nucleotide-binding universal stress UspA family protein